MAEAKQYGSRIWHVMAWAVVFAILVALCFYTWRGQFMKPPRSGPHVSAVQVKNDTGSTRDIQVEGDGARLMSIRLENGKSCLLLFSPPAAARAGEDKFMVRAFLVNDNASNDTTADVFSLVSLDYRKAGILSQKAALGYWTMPKGSRMFYFRDAAYKEIDVHMSTELGEESN